MPLPGDLINIKTVKPDSNLPDNYVVRQVNLNSTQQQYTGTGNVDLANIDARITSTLQNYGPAGFQGGNQGGSRSGFNFNFGLSGFPKISGLDKALGILGTGLAIIEGVKQLSNIGVALSQTVDALKAQAIAFRDSLASAIEAKSKEVEQKVLAERDKLLGTFTEVIPEIGAGKDSRDWRVKLTTNLFHLGGGTATSGWMSPLVNDSGVVFPYTPTVTVTHKANYKTTDVTHSIYTLQSYQNSTIDDISISGDFTCNTDEEGRYWLAAQQFFKSATKSFYGASVPGGMPPVVCRLSGYGTHMFDSVPVVIKSYSINLPKNIQYKGIMLTDTTKATTDMQYVPMESTITVVVAPMYNRQELRKFDIRDYSNNKLKGIL